MQQSGKLTILLSNPMMPNRPRIRTIFFLFPSDKTLYLYLSFLRRIFHGGQQFCFKTVTFLPTIDYDCIPCCYHDCNCRFQFFFCMVIWQL